MICPVNSFWARGYGDPPPEILIVLGASREDLEPRFETCERVGQSTNRKDIANEEKTDNPASYLTPHPAPPPGRRKRREGDR